MKEEFTLYELNQFIRRFVALNVPESIWITAEISQANLNKGNYYIDLVQKSRTSEEIVAQSYAVLWSKTFAQIANTKSSDIKQILKQGLKVRLRVRVDFHEKYGLKLVVEDIDESFTYGNLALQRAKTIKELQEKQLMDKNSTTLLPLMVKKIAVLSSKTAAGFKDFVAHLQNNEYGYTFEVKLFPIRVQGVNVESEFITQINKVDWTQFDLIAVIRGGGSKLDLAGFDSYAICEAIAKCPIPVLTGIGHEIDETVADMVSHMSLKTPTAVASFIVNRNLELESQLIRMNQEIGQQAKNYLRNEMIMLQQSTSELKSLATHKIESAQQFLVHYEQQLNMIAKHKLSKAKDKLAQWDQTISFLSVENTLKRGFSLTYTTDGKIAVEAEQLSKGQMIKTKLSKGSVKSKIQ